MAREIQLPCDGEDVCMLCKSKSPTDETITCTTCNTPWHMPCLTAESLASSSSGIHEWWCPDCSGDVDPVPVSGSGSDLIAAVRAIEADTSLTEEMKAKKRQKLMSGKANDEDEKNRKGKNIVVDNDEEMLDSVRKTFNCPICLDLPERPITTPCGHNFCLKCFEKWIGQGKFNCAQCRSSISKKAARNVRINLAIVDAIRLAKNSKRATTPTPKIQHHIHNEDDAAQP
ncbi:E3 ubiquitin-protein ligase ORTHRUS 2 [Cardamine amara subsp. amara]|uniref:RING-type E3 ubiquitin transferase n=1 Tax=Cardamine amara subsp. amara TaxID=228776 RepID=A0ABD1AQ94_CARAN